MAKQTLDGIPAERWSRIHELALGYANSVSKGRYVAAERARRQVLQALNRLQSRYGPRPSILATKGEYVKRPSQRERLLLDAFASAQHQKDTKNLTLICSSLAEFYADEAVDLAKARKWLKQLEKALVYHFDKAESEVLETLKKRLK